MKKVNYLDFLLLLSALIIFTLVLVNRSYIKENELQIEASLFQMDSLNYYKVYNNYIDKILKVNYEGGNASFEDIDFHILMEKEEKKDVDLLTGKRELLAIRYSSKGCNSCIDMLLRKISYLKRIKQKYDLVIIVDFQKFDDFFKWKRSTISDSEKFIWTNDPLPLDTFIGSSSYTFIVDENYHVRSIFIPNNLFPDDLLTYIESIL